jgi:hypothetical protein
VAVKTVRDIPVHINIVYIREQFIDFSDGAGCSCAVEGWEGSEEFLKFGVILVPRLVHRGSAENAALVMYAEVWMGVFGWWECLISGEGPVDGSLFGFL